MSIPKRGSRTRVVDQTSYRWYVRKNPSKTAGLIESNMQVAIELVADHPTSVLIADLGVSRPDNWVRSHQTALKPRMISEIIRQGLAEGWNPEVPGPQFRTRYSLVMDSC